MRMASSADMLGHCSTDVPAGTRCRCLTPSSSRVLFWTGLILKGCVHCRRPIPSVPPLRPFR